jgi:hypothetical protein
LDIDQATRGFRPTGRTYRHIWAAMIVSHLERIEPFGPPEVTL